MTENDQTENLTDRQMKAIPHLVSSPTFEEGRKKARLSKNALYSWLRNPVFKDELIRQRNVVISDALETLKGNLVKAADTLVGLLRSESESLRRHVANDIINHVFRAIELQEFEKRLSEIEQIVFEKRGML